MKLYQYYQPSYQFVLKKNLQVNCLTLEISLDQLILRFLRQRNLLHLMDLLFAIFH
ncbi:hypothetical protein C2G38_2081501, partial [Gigaspora rosea]